MRGEIVIILSLIICENEIKTYWPNMMENELSSFGSHCGIFKDESYGIILTIKCLFI